MGVMSHRRAPGVQHQCHPKAGAEMLGVSGDREQGLGSRLEQETVEDRLVVIGEVSDRRRQGEDHMVVVHGQELGLAGLKPVPGCTGLTLGAMPIPAGNGVLSITCIMGSTS